MCHVCYPFEQGFLNFSDNVASGKGIEQEFKELLKKKIYNFRWTLHIQKKMVS